ncbi:MAG: ATP-dependent DNA helicase [Deltaproteobacteria bacterium]|nr:ATP-dependent DNA helicase [Deltaproteobacteria bacterium]
MTEPYAAIERILGKGGVLSSSLNNFEYRPSQLQMALAIMDSIQGKKPVIIEAGTGTGKTYGYLVPALLSGKKTVISTGTKNLQEQIYLKDLPVILKSTGKSAKAMMMKGRKNYLCLYRYHQYFSATSGSIPIQKEIRNRLERWITETLFADREELSWLKDDDPLWDDISSSHEQCLGNTCPHVDECFLNALRRSAVTADMIIVNHHLFFADLMVKKGGFGEIIPRFQLLIFDEAHGIEDIATSYFGESLSTNQLMEFTTDLDKETRVLHKKLRERLLYQKASIMVGAENLRAFFEGREQKGRISQETWHRIEEGPLRAIMEGLKHIAAELADRDLDSKNLMVLSSRADALNQRLLQMLSSHDANWLRWYEKRKKTLVIHVSPLDISSTMNELLYEKVSRIVFTSATLSTNRNFDYFRSRLGLQGDILEEIYPSHFDFTKQTLMFVPRDIPSPSSPRFCEAIAVVIKNILGLTSGRALILFTSHRNLDLVWQLISRDIPYTVFKQGDAPRTLLLEKFRRDTNSVLMATGSFWQGVDVPGDALSCLIIDKLPFDSPADPLVSARIESIREKGRNPFIEYQLPSAIIALKQGLGRLIRNSSDRGIICILDNRLLTSNYGPTFLNSLPDMHLSHDLGEIRRFFQGSP